MSDSYVAHLEAQPDEWKRLRRLEDVVWNYLGTRDPTALADWINGARLELAEHRAEETPAHVAPCAPQADGADEQDVIAIQRAYTASRDGC